MNDRTMKDYVAVVVLLAICAAGWLVDRTLFWAAYLAAWWFAAGVVLGALANVWIHTLTGGTWGEVIRAPALRIARTMPLLAALFLPLGLGLHDLYSWSTHASDASRWSGELSSAAFKSAWLTPGFFVARSVAYVAVWLVLAAATSGPRERDRRFSILALLLYWLTASLAAIDWIMSLMPLWYSTAFPPLVVTGQMLAGFAAVVMAATIRANVPKRVYRDLGNLLLVYVLSWAYLAFTQYLIIWAENLPHEIAWYVVRLHTGWYFVGWLLVACHFFIPLAVLLSRDAKEAPFVLGVLAGFLLLLHLFDVWWLIVPSVRPGSVHVLWLAPLVALALGTLAAARVRGAPSHERASHA